MSSNNCTGGCALEQGRHHGYKWLQEPGLLTGFQHLVLLVYPFFFMLSLKARVIVFVQCCYAYGYALLLVEWIQ